MVIQKIRKLEAPNINKNREKTGRRRIVTLGISIPLNDNLVCRWSSGPMLSQCRKTKAIKVVRQYISVGDPFSFHSSTNLNLCLENRFNLSNSMYILYIIPELRWKKSLHQPQKNTTYSSRKMIEIIEELEFASVRPLVFFLFLL